MNNIKSIFKRKTIFKKKNIYHFNKISTKYLNDKQCLKTTNILNRPIVIVFFLKYLDLYLESFRVTRQFLQKDIYEHVHQILLKSKLLLSDIIQFTLHVGNNTHEDPKKIFKINKYSNTSILDIILKYNSPSNNLNHSSTVHPPLRLNILITPSPVPLNLYVDYKNTILLCTFKECIICFDKKYLKPICDNRHHICFSCVQLMEKYKQKYCPLCRKKIHLI